jgi:hypothetical protein
MVQEFKAGRAQKAKEDAKLLEEQTSRKGFASKLRTDAKLSSLGDLCAEEGCYKVWVRKSNLKQC